MDKEEVDNAAYEKQLGDIIEIAEDAIYHATGRDESAKAKLYVDAIEKVRSLLCWPIEVAKRRNWLDMGDFKLMGVDLADDAIYHATGRDESAKAKLYADAIEKGRSLLCWPVEVAKRRNYLDMGDFKLVRFHAGNTTTFVGTRKHKQGTGGMLLEGTVINLNGFNKIKMIVDGEEFFDGTVDGGMHKAERVLVGAMHGYNAWKIANRRNRGGQKGWDQE